MKKKNLEQTNAAETMHRTETDYCLIGSQKDLMEFKGFIENHDCCFDADDFFYRKENNIENPFESIFLELNISALTGIFSKNNLYSFFVKEIQKSESGKFYTYCYSEMQEGNCFSILDMIIKAKEWNIKILWRQYKEKTNGKKYDIKTNDDGKIWYADGTDVYYHERNPGKWL